ncbi:p53 and DNA damage-regulated protein 1 isoform X1 [Daktulosphaira vitifoliae]|uniref:p53 and DNA damage-regulated protein 1 isoform X1 n=1 Tax=Daktulosphaira vitifoliae TaxID=58002 RepID=UPI0021A9F2F6|nr:p53 and DNA damage-regulated protein 1 isoform X1 [Daktulosphaira vitifoliae]
MNFEKTTMDYLFCVEKQAEEILVDKSEIVALDKKRNDNRMAIRAIINNKMPQNKTWIAVGPLLIKVTENRAKEMLQEGIKVILVENIFISSFKQKIFSDQILLDSRINKIHSDLKIKVNKLRDMEYQEPVKGLFLNPLTKKEMNAMNQLLSGHSS